MRLLVLLTLTCGWVVIDAPMTSADDAPSAVGPVMKLLKSGRVPATRLGAILEQVAKRGNEHDLAFLYQQAVVEEAYDPELRDKILERLVVQATDRGIIPAGDLSRIATLIESAGDHQAQLKQTAIRLAGLWKVTGASSELVKILSDSEAAPDQRDAAMTALSRIGGDTAREAVLSLTDAKQPVAMRFQGVAALVDLDINLAARQAAAVLREATPEDDPQAMVSAFLAQQGGSAILAKAVQGSPPTADVAKLALRAMYSVGRSDAELSAALGKIAGIDADPVPLTKEQVLAMVPEVDARGDATRGEAIFRRAELSCMKCHAISKGGGQIGPDLSALGASSPKDYIIHSISDPDQQIKEAYITRVVLTDEGQVLQGIVVDRTDDALILKDATGKHISIPTDSIDDEITGKSLMPRGLMKFMTDSEFLDLVKFLSMLGKPNTEYAIRSTPRMQRFRVLTKVPERFQSKAPDFTNFEEHVYESPYTQPVYARVNGEVPLDEVLAVVKQPVLFLVGEIDVTSGGEIGVRVDDATGVTLWLDKQSSTEKETTGTLDPGRHTINVRIDTGVRPTDTFILELFRVDGSKAEFTVVDGA